MKWFFDTENLNLNAFLFVEKKVLKVNRWFKRNRERMKNRQQIQIQSKRFQQTNQQLYKIYNLTVDISPIWYKAENEFWCQTNDGYTYTHKVTFVVRHRWIIEKLKQRWIDFTFFSVLRDFLIQAIREAPKINLKFFESKRKFSGYFLSSIRCRY